MTSGIDEDNRPNWSDDEVNARVTKRESTATHDELVIENLPLVRLIARRIHKRLPSQMSIEDLHSAGVLGLIDATQKFDPAKHVRFGSFAQFRIRGAILDSLRSLDWGPRELRRKAREIEELIPALTAQFGRPPSESEIAQRLHMELICYQQLRGKLKGLEVFSLHARRANDSDMEEEIAYLPNPPEDDPESRLLRQEMRARLTEAISALPERERLVMDLYYYEETTMKEIALMLNVVECRVSQIHASALFHLRAKLSGSDGQGSTPRRQKVRRRSPNPRIGLGKKQHLTPVQHLCAQS